MDTQTVPAAADTDHAPDCYWNRATPSVDGDESACCSCGAIAAAIPDERAIYVQALRDLADFLESHEDVPVDDNDTLGPWMGFGHKITPERAVELADALDGVVVHDGGYVKLCRAFGPITYRINLHESEVCQEREQITKVQALPEALQRRERSS